MSTTDECFWTYLQGFTMEKNKEGVNFFSSRDFWRDNICYRYLVNLLIILSQISYWDRWIQFFCIARSIPFISSFCRGTMSCW